MISDIGCNIKPQYSTKRQCCVSELAVFHLNRILSESVWVVNRTSTDSTEPVIPLSSLMLIWMQNGLIGLVHVVPLVHFDVIRACRSTVISYSSNMSSLFVNIYLKKLYANVEGC